MSSYHLKIATPDGARFDGEAERLILRAAQGDLAVLARHAPLMTTVRAGRVRIALPDGTEKAARTTGGLLTVGAAETVALLAGFEWEEE